MGVVKMKQFVRKYVLQMYWKAARFVMKHSVCVKLTFKH